ncbi:HAD-IA family hydrolase [Actinomyces sp. W5033]|uniref:HAD-IA family hydrolase n=1 Tax=Actinomyces sp. W5033 TaxID=3446479 RepID=UPI003EE09919
MEHSSGSAPQTACAGHGAVPIDAVVLDWGNVLHRWQAHRAVQGRVDPSVWEEMATTGEFTRWNALWDAGATKQEVLAAVAAEQPARTDKVEAMRTYWEHFEDTLTGPVPGTAALVQALLGAGTPLYCLTNFNHLLWPLGRERVPELARFRGVVVSGEERLVKPDARVYRLLLERYGLSAGRTLFVDDSAANTAGAAAVGLLTHHFTTAAALREDLAARGLLPAAID